MSHYQETIMSENIKFMWIVSLQGRQLCLLTPFKLQTSAWNRRFVMNLLSLIPSSVKLTQLCHDLGSFGFHGLEGREDNLPPGLWDTSMSV